MSDGGKRGCFEPGHLGTWALEEVTRAGTRAVSGATRHETSWFKLSAGLIWFRFVEFALLLPCCLTVALAPKAQSISRFCYYCFRDRPALSSTICLDSRVCVFTVYV